MSTYYIGTIPCSGSDVYHFGRKGMKWGKNIFGKLAEFVTGNNARRNLQVANTRLHGTNVQHRIASQHDYNDVEHNGSVLNRASRDNWYARDQRNEAQKAYDKTLPGMAENAQKKAAEAMAKAREEVSSAYAKAAEAAGGAGKNIQSFYSDVMSKAKATISKGQSMVSKYGSQYVDQIKTLGENALAGGKSFLEGIMDRAKNAGNNAREFVTGEKAAKELKKATYASRNAHSYDDVARLEDRYRKKHRNHAKVAEITGIKGDEYSRGKVKSWSEDIRSHNKNVADADKRLADAQASYDKTLPGRMIKKRKK